MSKAFLLLATFSITVLFLALLHQSVRVQVSRAHACCGLQRLARRILRSLRQ